MQYYQRVLTFRPANVLRYWRLNEASGTTAADSSGNGYNGVATGVTWGAAGMGDGFTAASLSGLDGRLINVYSANLASVFNGAAGTLLIWAKVSGAGVWSDAASRYIYRFAVNADNYVRIFKSTDNKLYWEYKAGTTLEQISKIVSETGWMCLALTWDKAADQVKMVYNGVQEGATQTGLGTWAGSLDSTLCTIGARSTAAIEVWSGSLAHAVLWNVALTVDEIKALYQLTYQQMTWVDEVLAATPAKMTITDDTLGAIAGSATIDLVAAAVAGTPRTAANLNHIEQGINDLEAATAPAILTTKGDLVSASAADTAVILPVGAAGTYLVPDASQASGLKWAQMITAGYWISTGLWNSLVAWPPTWGDRSTLRDTTFTITPSTDFVAYPSGSAIPSAAKMILINAETSWIWWQAGLTSVYLASPSGVSIERAFMICQDFETPGGIQRTAGWIPLDSNGQFALRAVHYEAFITLRILAYML